MGRVVLLKQGQRYAFACAAGEEAALIKSLGEMARDPHSPIQWFDVAMVSHQLGVGLRRQLDRAAPPRVPTVRDHRTDHP